MAFRENSWEFGRLRCVHATTSVCCDRGRKGWACVVPGLGGIFVEGYGRWMTCLSLDDLQGMQSLFVIDDAAQSEERPKIHSSVGRRVTSDRDVVHHMELSYETLKHYGQKGRALGSDVCLLALSVTSHFAVRSWDKGHRAHECIRYQFDRTGMDDQTR